MIPDLAEAYLLLVLPRLRRRKRTDVPLLGLVGLFLATLPLGAASPLIAQRSAQLPTHPSAQSGAPTPAAPGAASVAGRWAPDREEPGSSEAIARFTTEERYLPRSVAYVPDSDTVPSPTDFLGHLAGAPGELSSVDQVHGYFRALGEASPRVWVETVGTTEEGRELLLAAVSSEANLADLDRLAEINRALSDPRRTPREEAEALAAGGKVFYYLIGGLHSVETGSPEMLMELAYRLAVSERPEIRELRDRLVILITPVAEPDGRDRVVQWYRRHLRGRDLPWEVLREIASPPYWGHYAFHDNNRDGMQRALALTRAIQGVFFRFQPQVMHDLHESLPLLYISTGHGPYSHAVDPVTINEWTSLAHSEAAALEAQGLPGVWVWAFWDGWWPGYLISVANNHNSVGRFYETFGNISAETFTRDLSEVRFAGQPVTEVEWYRPWPPDKKTEWSLRNNTNYMEAGVLAALTTAARNAEDLLLDHWIKAERALTRGRKESPHAWIFPPGQRDPARLDHLVNLLVDHGIEVHRLSGDLSLGAPPGAKDAGETGGGESRDEETASGENGKPIAAADRSVRYPAGSYVVRMDQPFRNAALNFLERQQFPPDEPNPPYDDVAWTWPLLFGVEGESIDDPAVLEVPAVEPEGGRPAGEPPAEERPASEPGVEGSAADPEPVMERVRGRVHTPGKVTGFGDEIFLLEDRGQTSLLTARVRLGDRQVDAAESPFEAAGRTWPVGSWIVYATRAEVETLASDLGLDFEAVPTLPEIPRRHIVDLPRLGVAHTWTSTQNAGWVRYALDQAGMPYRLVSPDDLRRGGLAARFDVIVFPDTSGDLRRMVHGIDPSLGPLAYTATPEFPSHGIPDGSPDITGGMGFEGLLELQRFIEAGGVLVTFGNAGTLAVDGGLVRRVDRVQGDFKTPGSELQARVLRSDHPITYGYREFPSIFRGNGPLWEVDRRQRGWVVAQFGTKLPDRDSEEANEARTDRESRPTTGSEPETPATQEPELVEEELSEETVEIREASTGPEESRIEPETAGAVESTSAGAKSEPPKELVLSGGVRGKDKIEGKPAILDVPVGSGRVILFAFNPLHRDLNLSDFRFAWNVLLNWNDLPGGEAR